MKQVNGLVYLVAAVIYLFDQLLKWLVRATIPVGQAVPVIPHVVDFYHLQNPGAAFSIFPNQTWLFVLIALVVIVAVIYVQRRFRPGRLAEVGLGLLLGGALGNMTDRIVNHTVTDYVNFYTIHFAVFNLADASIDIGVILLLIYSFRPSQSNARQSTDERDKEDVSK